MIELSYIGSGAFKRAFGGDTLNTAVYLSRLGIPATYVTALGDDAISDEMIASWQTEGVHTQDVLRVANTLPGLYIIERDRKGERSFLYWRGQSPARKLFNLASEALLERLADFDWLYFSGITLSLYDKKGRLRLIDLLREARRRGGRIAFDGNYRPRGWPDAASARTAFNQVLPLVDLAMVTGDDETALFGDADAQQTLARISAAGVGEIVVKAGPSGCLVASSGRTVEVKPPRIVDPVDTTAAGDSFNAGYLAARIKGATIADAAAAGHRLAGAVIMSPGALIAPHLMPRFDERNAL